MSQAVANVASLAASPVSASAPTGESVRLDAAFETLKAEIDKLSSAGVSGVDWRKVVSLSAEITEKKSKDLLVLAYLCRGLLQVDGYGGFAEGLDGLLQVMTAYWDKVFPERPKARIAAIQWLAEKSTQAAVQKDARTGDQQALETAVEKAKAIDALLGDRFGGEAPPLSEFIRSLSDRLDSIAAPGAPTHEAVATSGPAPAAVATAAVDLSTPDGIQHALDSAQGILRDVTMPMRRADPASPVPWRTSRYVAWSAMSVFPPNEGGLSLIPGGPASADLLAQFEDMAGRGQWAELLEAAESTFEQSILWIDTQRFVAASLRGMGAAFDLARNAVIGELAALLRALPGLQDLKFNDGFPLASDATRAWIGAEVMAGSAEFASPTAVSVKASPEDTEINEILGKARDLAGQKNLKEAIHLVWVALDGVGPRRQRFMRKLALAHFLADANEHRLAVPVLEALDEEIRRYTLEEWEPGLSLDALRLHLHCQRQLLRDEEPSQEALRKEKETFARLARLDAAAALELKAK